jgi:hypothetical protein
MLKFYQLLIAAVLSLILCANLAWGAGVNIKLGIFDPRGAKSGFIGGISTARGDEMIDYGLGLDLFVRQYSDETVVDTSVSQGGNQTMTVRTNISYSMYGLPIMAHLTVRLLPGSVIRPYASVGAGYEIVFSREANYNQGVDPTNRLYGGFGLQFMIGGEYVLARTSSLLGEIFYNACTVRRGSGTTQGFPTHEELNFSGFGFRVGARINAL